jgi:hypothetical protein
VKWYENYPDVKGILDMFELVKALEIPYAYTFVRIGEDYEDLQVVEEMSEDDEALEMSYLLEDALTIERSVAVNDV